MFSSKITALGLALAAVEAALDQLEQNPDGTVTLGADSAGIPDSRSVQWFTADSEDGVFSQNPVATGEPLTDSQFETLQGGGEITLAPPPECAGGNFCFLRIGESASEGFSPKVATDGLNVDGPVTEDDDDDDDEDDDDDDEEDDDDDDDEDGLTAEEVAELAEEAEEKRNKAAEEHEKAVKDAQRRSSSDSSDDDDDGDDDDDDDESDTREGEVEAPDSSAASITGPAVALVLASMLAASL